VASADRSALGYKRDRHRRFDGDHDGYTSAERITPVRRTQEATMPTWAWILVVAAIIVVGVVAVVLMQQRQRAGLQERFGPEYDRVVEEREDRRQAERELAERAERRDKLDIRPLTSEQRGEYAARWESVQAAFVDRPREAVVLADDLIVEVMDRRGYPVENFDDRASLVSADHPEVVDHYRSAHAVSAQGEDSSTEDLRQAFVHYRALFDAMLTDAEPEPRTDRADDELLDGRPAVENRDEQGRRL
jgi:hypothetical protein